MFSSATVILFGGTVGALAYLESSAANADKLFEEISLFYKVLCTILNRWVVGRSSRLGMALSTARGVGGWRWSLVTADDKSLVLGIRREADAGNLSISVIS